MRLGRSTVVDPAFHPSGANRWHSGPMLTVCAGLGLLVPHTRTHHCRVPVLVVGWLTLRGCRPGVEWYVANANMRVCMYKAARNGQHAVELAQSGTVRDTRGVGGLPRLPSSPIVCHAYACMQAGLQCGLELDSFLSPMNPGTYNGVPVGMQPSKPLDQVSALNLTFGFDLVYSAVSDRCGTGNQVSMCPCITLLTCHHHLTVGVVLG